MIRYVCLIASVVSLPTFALTLTASAFNAIYSCTTPFIATETTVITLDENIIISAAGACELFQVGVGFDPLTDSITFSAAQGNAVVVTNGTTWKISLPILFTGNAQLRTQYGSSLWFNGGSLVLMNSSLMTEIP